MATDPPEDEMPSPEWGNEYQLHTYSGTSDAGLNLTPEALDDLRSSLIEETARTIPALYESGVQFFSKGAIADIVAQVNSCRDADGQIIRGRRVLLPKINGGTQAVELETGEVLPFNTGSLPDGAEDVVGEPMLEYRTYQRMSMHINDMLWYDPNYAYTPFKLCYRINRRRKSTGQAVTWPNLDSTEKLSNYFTKFRQEWGVSDVCKLFQKRLSEVRIPHITNIVAFACSNMKINDGERRAAESQHALILTLRNFLQEKADARIECFAQEPAYTPENKETLEGNGIKVLEDPLGFLEVNDTSAVLAVSANIPVRQIVADISRPAILIWNKVHDEEDDRERWKERGNYNPGLRTDPESSRLRELMEREYEEIATLQGDNDEVSDPFYDTVVYIRKH